MNQVETCGGFCVLSYPNLKLFSSEGIHISQTHWALRRAGILTAGLHGNPCNYARPSFALIIKPIWTNQNSKLRGSICARNYAHMHAMCQILIIQCLIKCEFLVHIISSLNILQKKVTNWKCYRFSLLRWLSYIAVMWHNPAYQSMFTFPHL